MEAFKKQNELGGSILITNTLIDLFQGRDGCHHARKIMQKSAGGLRKQALTKRGIVVEYGNEQFLIPFGKIKYIQRDTGYTNIVHESGADLVTLPLKRIDDYYFDKFIYVNRNCIVPKRAVRNITYQEGVPHCTVKGNNAKLEISRRKLRDVEFFVQTEKEKRSVKRKNKQ